MYALTGAIPPGGITAEMLIEMLPTAFELITDKTDPVEIGSHGKAFILLLDLFVASILLGERLMVQGQSKHNVGPDFPGVQSAVEASELHGVVTVEEAVQIEKVVAAVVVMLLTPLVIALIPDILNLLKARWFGCIQPFYQIGIHFLTVAHPLRRNLERLVKEVVMTGDNVDEVPDAPGGVVEAVQMDMDTAGVVGEASRFAQAAHQFL